MANASGLKKRVLSAAKRWAPLRRLLLTFVDMTIFVCVK